MAKANQDGNFTVSLQDAFPYTVQCNFYRANFAPNGNFGRRNMTDETYHIFDILVWASSRQIAAEKLRNIIRNSYASRDIIIKTPVPSVNATLDNKK